MTRYSFLLLLTVLLLNSCVKDSVKHTYTLLKPVYKAKEAVLSEVGSQPAQALNNPGKIFVYGNYLFVNEINKGVHIIDNSNPSSPVNRRFVNIPGNVDIAVRGNTLYADIFTDMLTLDISNPLDVAVTNVTRDVFPERQYGNGFQADASQYIVDWIKKDTTVDYQDNNGNRCWGCGMWFSTEAMQSLSSSAVTKITTGIAGSMARFSIVSNYLYAVNQSSLVVFDITSHTQPDRLNLVPIGWNIETIYPFQDKLFIGSATGMFVYDISNPVAPTYTSSVSHIRMCDPVIADDRYAYVTLRAGSECGAVTGSQLQVLDVSNISNPVVLRTISMTNPYGLGKTGTLLWICDGTDGLKVFDAKDPLQLSLKHHIRNLEPFDVIPLGDRIIVSAKEGIVQFDASSPGKITELSRIKKQ
ncbi:MAG: hypothetical protein KIT80_16815 [Chitinophagaceae bacterium]|nr:hypothetical protein [Chitinophagaceae bacterium]MCW5928582.1 hypothetical protein [Chitinophagaceae bacterium]